MTLPPGRIAVVVNGNAKSVTNDVISTLDQILAGGDLFVSRDLEEAAQIAATLVEQSYDTVLTGGGDGTFTVMVTEIWKAAHARNKPMPRLGLLRLGTGNALAWVLGASPGKAGLKADIARLHQETGSREIRLVDVEGYLTPFAGVGADAQVLADYAATKKVLQKSPLKPLSAGLFTYALAATTRSLPKFIGGPLGHVRIINDGDDAYEVLPGANLSDRAVAQGEVLYEGPARIAALSTIPYYGFALRMFPYSDLKPDRMQLRVSTMGTSEFLTNLTGIWRGTYHDRKSTRDFLVDKVIIECDPAADFQIGGDPQGNRSTIHAAVTREPVRLVDFYEPPSE